MLKAERPFFINPLGNWNERPEKLITYHGYLAMPKVASGYRHNRAKITILAFDLNREALTLERAEDIQDIQDIWIQTRLMERGEVTDRKMARERLKRLLAPTHRHTNCLNSFYKLCSKDPDEAHRTYKECELLL